MKPKKFDNPLVEQVLTDMACSFFGARTQLEDMIEAFYTYVDILKEKASEISAAAGLIDYLLSDKQASEEFFKLFSADCPESLSECTLSDDALPDSLPFSITAKGEFTHLMLWAYSKLQKACHEYLNGYEGGEYLSDEFEVEEHDDADSKKCSETVSLFRKNIYFKLLKSMCDLINNKVKEINSSNPPFSLLQYVKQFDVEAESHEPIAIPVFSANAESLNEKLAFKPIDFDSLNIQNYPELPKRERVESAITAFCKKYYTDHKDAVKKRVATIKEKIAQKQEYAD